MPVSLETTEPTHQLLVRFYSGGSTLDVRLGDRWVPFQVVPPAELPEHWDAEEWRVAINDLIDAAGLVTHLVDVALGKEL